MLHAGSITWRTIGETIAVRIHMVITDAVFIGVHKVRTLPHTLIAAASSTHAPIHTPVSLPGSHKITDPVAILINEILFTIRTGPGSGIRILPLSHSRQGNCEDKHH